MIGELFSSLLRRACPDASELAANTLLLAVNSRHTNYKITVAGSDPRHSDRNGLFPRAVSKPRSPKRRSSTISGGALFADSLQNSA